MNKITTLISYNGLLWALVYRLTHNWEAILNMTKKTNKKHGLYYIKMLPLFESSN